MRAGVDGQLGAGADGADLGFDENLIRGGGRQLDLADRGAERFGDDGLTYVHDGLRWRTGRQPRLPYRSAAGTERRVVRREYEKSSGYGSAGKEVDLTKLPEHPRNHR